MFGKAKVEKPPMYNGTANKLTNWIFLMGQYLDIVRVTNSNMCAKFAIVLFEGKALTWWHMFSQTASEDVSIIQWNNLYVNLSFGTLIVS